MDSKPLSTDKPHVICITAPAQGHMKAMLDLAKLLYHKGFHITFVNTESSHRRLLESRGPRSLDHGLPDGFRFEAIPDGFPPDASWGFSDHIEALTKHLYLTPFRCLLAKLNGDTRTSNVSPVTCIVSDFLMVSITTTVAEELGIPVVVFYSISPCSVMGTIQYDALRAKGLTPLKDESYLINGYLDTVIDWIPGMKDIRLRDLPSFFRTTDPDDLTVNFITETTEGAYKATAVVLHSFEALERDVLDALSFMFPQVYTVGPLPLILNGIPENNPLKSVGHTLRKEDTSCLQWLNSRPPNSVIYVNFGSIAVMTHQQLIEFGWGLANSKHPFLWIVRPDLVIGDAAILPSEFVADTKERGMVTSWCPQEQVLNHKSIGGFLTHSGWNSTIESISAGVPMLCWPRFGDQQINSRYTCTEWGIGMEIDNNVKRDEVAKLVRELMEGEKGKKMRNKAMEWKSKAEEATARNGSSSIALDKLIDEVLLS